MVVLQTYLVEPVQGIAMLELPLSFEPTSGLIDRRGKKKIDLPFVSLYIWKSVSVDEFAESM